MFSLPSLSHCQPLLIPASLLGFALLFTTISSSTIHSTDSVLSSSHSLLPTSAEHSYPALVNLTSMSTAALSATSSLASAPLAAVSNSSLSSLSASSFLSSFFSSLCLIFMAELGDKTFLSTLFLSSSLPASSSLLSASSLTLLFGSNAAAATLAVLSAVLSSVSASMLTSWGLTLLRGAASTACVVFGVQMLYETYRDSCEGATQPNEASTDKRDSASTFASASQSAAASSSLLSLFLHTYLVSLATELGDHSQFSFLLLTSHPSAPSAVPIVLGGVLGHILCTLIAILGGGWVLRLGWHERHIRWMGGGLFLAMALLQTAW